MKPDPVLAILCEDRLLECGGELYSLNAFGSPHWRLYAEIFPNLAIVARVEQGARPGKGEALSTHDGLALRPIPSFQGPLGLLRRLPIVALALRRALRGADGYIVRWPGTLTLLALPYLLASRKPIAIEVVGDSLAVFRSGVGGPASGVLARLSQAAARRLFAAASAVTYVTRRHLQERYPAAPQAIVSACTDVALSEADLAARPRPAGSVPHRPARLLFAGTMEQRYKGIDTLLAAVFAMKAEGCAVALRLAGTGRFDRAVQTRIAELGLEDSVTPLGRLSRAELLAEMDQCDLFVVPSLTEGLPRTIIEAMARGAPIVASAVGGIFELLPPQCLVEPGSPPALADKLSECLAQPERLAAMSERNLREARNYTDTRTDPIRRSFYIAFRSLM